METLARLNRLAERSSHMATVLLVHVDPARERLTYASAGHLPGLLVAPDGRARFLEGGASTPLLAFQSGGEPGTASLEPGARLVLYTDGLVERRTEPIDESLERLRAAADGFDGPAEALCEHLMEAMRPPAGAPHDDIAVIALGRSG
jgi:serine phosphatase RsbU (regulator of sigma subunit)